MWTGLTGFSGLGSGARGGFWEGYWHRPRGGVFVVRTPGSRRLRYLHPALRLGLIGLIGLMGEGLWVMVRGKRPLGSLDGNSF